MIERLTPFGADGECVPLTEDHGLRRRAVRGVGATVFSQGSTLAIQMVSTVVLARLLAPADFGVVAMVTTFSLVLTSFGQNGFTEAIIQWEEFDRRTANNLFWINIGAGLFLSGVFAMAGSLLARFYRDPLVDIVALAISPTIFITSTSVVHLALLKRAMRFSAVAANDIVACAVSVPIAILVAVMGWGFWALIAAAIALPLSTSIGAWWLCRWTPGFPGRTPKTRSMVKFSFSVYERFSVRYFVRNTDKLLVGWQFNAAALGFYKKAYDLFALSANQLVSPVNDVALAALSRLNRDPVRFKRYFLNALAMIAFVGMGLGVDLTLVGRDVVRLVLGPKWQEAGRIFTLFGPGIGLTILHSTSGWIHLSIGRPERWLRWTVLELVVTGLLFVLGLRWGPVGMASAWSASFCLLTVPSLWYAGRPIQFGISPMLGEIWRYGVASVFTGVACTVIMRKIPSFLAASSAGGSFEGIVCTSALFLVLYVGSVAALHGGFVPVRQFVGLLREMAPTTRVANPRSPAISNSRIDSSEVVPLVARSGKD